MWRGRQDLLFRDANLSHQRLVALARVVTTKVVLRPEGSRNARSGDGHTWDFLFHQSGMAGPAICVGTASSKNAMQHFPLASLQGAFAVTFIVARKDVVQDLV